MRIGIDFDNTLAQYDHLFVRLAIEWGVHGAAGSKSKQDVRQLVREKDELLWQRLQGQIYGRLMQEAIQFPGVHQFLRRCASSASTEVFIVSHKTQFGHFDQTRVDLRESARLWMRNNGFFYPGIYAIPEQNLFFESTREEKIMRIANLECDIFIDDLPEIFEHSDFPVNTRKILFAHDFHKRSDDMFVCANWAEIEASVFGN